MRIIIWSLVVGLSLAGALRARAYNLVLGWNTSASTAAAGYNVYYGTNSGQYPGKINVGNLTTVTISNLTAGVAYYVTATAYDANGGESPFSSEISVVTPGALTLFPNPTAGAPPTFLFSAQSGHWYEVQATTDFQNWSSIWQSGVVSASTAMQGMDSDASAFNARFYRLVQH